MDAFPTDRQWRLNEDAPLPTQGVTAWPGITQSCMPPDDAEGHVGGGGEVWCAERNAGPEEVIRKGTEFYNLKLFATSDFGAPPPSRAYCPRHLRHDHTCSVGSSNARDCAETQ